VVQPDAAYLEVTKGFHSARLNALQALMHKDVVDVMLAGLRRDPMGVVRKSREGLFTAADEASRELRIMGKFALEISTLTWCSIRDGVKPCFEEGPPDWAAKCAETLMEAARVADVKAREKDWKWLDFDLTMTERVTRYETALKVLCRDGFKAAGGDEKLKAAWQKAMDWVKPLAREFHAMAKAYNTAGLGLRKTKKESK